MIDESSLLEIAGVICVEYEKLIILVERDAPEIKASVERVLGHEYRLWRIELSGPALLQGGSET